MANDRLCDGERSREWIQWRDVTNTDGGQVGKAEVHEFRGELIEVFRTMEVGLGGNLSTRLVLVLAITQNGQAGGSSEASNAAISPSHSKSGLLCSRRTQRFQRKMASLLVGRLDFLRFGEGAQGLFQERQ